MRERQSEIEVQRHWERWRRDTRRENNVACSKLLGGTQPHLDVGPPGLSQVVRRLSLVNTARRAEPRLPPQNCAACRRHNG